MIRTFFARVIPVPALSADAPLSLGTSGVTPAGLACRGRDENSIVLCDVGYDLK